MWRLNQLVGLDIAENGVYIFSNNWEGKAFVALTDMDNILRAFKYNHRNITHGYGTRSKMSLLTITFFRIFKNRCFLLNQINSEFHLVCWSYSNNSGNMNPYHNYPSFPKYHLVLRSCCTNSIGKIWSSW